MTFFRWILPVVLVAVALPAFAASPSNVNKTRNPAASVARPTPNFAKVIDDLPLMPGLTAQEDKDVLFVAGPGRIAQTTATGMIDIDDVYYYYEDSLPQLGWKKINARIYERGGERLRLDVSGANPAGLTIVCFSVEPVTSKGW
jgi:hypothetical protein